MAVTFYNESIWKSSHSPDSAALRGLAEACSSPLLTCLILSHPLQVRMSWGILQITDSRSATEKRIHFWEV